MNGWEIAKNSAARIFLDEEVQCILCHKIGHNGLVVHVMEVTSLNKSLL